MHSFLRDDRIIRDIATGNKSHLHGRDDVVESGFDTVGKNFGDSIVDSVTETNRSEVINFIGIFRLRNQRDESVIEGRMKMIPVKEV